MQPGTSQKPGPGRSFRSTLSGLVPDTKTQGEDDMPSSCPGKVGKVTEDSCLHSARAFVPLEAVGTR